MILPTLYLLVGASGTGKTFWGQTFAAQNSEVVYLSSDSFRGVVGTSESDQTVSGFVFSILRANVEYFLKQGKTILVDATNTRVSARNDFTKIAKKLRVPVVAVCFKTPLETALKRNLERSRQVPEDVIRRQFSQMIWPTLEEVNEIVEIK